MVFFLSAGTLVNTGQTEQDWINMLMVSPLFQQITDLQEMVDKAAGASPVSDKILGESNYSWDEIWLKA